MLLPFVRELFADVEKLARFRACCLPPERGHGADSCLRAHPDRQSPAAGAAAASGRPPADRRCQRQSRRRGPRARPARVLRTHAALRIRTRSSPCPRATCCPFQNLSPHPEIQEERATALWKIATGSGVDRGRAGRGDRHPAALRPSTTPTWRARAPRRVVRHSKPARASEHCRL